MDSNPCRHLHNKELLSKSLPRAIKIYSKILEWHSTAGFRDSNRIIFLETLEQTILSKLHSIPQWRRMNMSQKCLFKFCNLIYIWIQTTLQYMVSGTQSSTCKMLRIVSLLLITIWFKQFSWMRNSSDGMRWLQKSSIQNLEYPQY